MFSGDEFPSRLFKYVVKKLEIVSKQKKEIVKNVNGSISWFLDT